jgi:hypothetical protein
MNAIQAATQFLASLGMATATPANRSAFNRSKLPSPSAFWQQHGIQLKEGRNGWQMAKCIFHDDHHESLSINSETGGFFCHACNAKGGDVVAAHQAITGSDFVTAAKALNAWERES